MRHSCYLQDQVGKVVGEKDRRPPGFPGAHQQLTRKLCGGTGSLQQALSTWLCCELAGALLFRAAKPPTRLLMNLRNEEASFKGKGFRGNPAAWHLLCFPCLHLPGTLQ
ncbi:Olfactory Receptor 13J1 [Manis pentadactyla]|nr:Olfactory Receptor 13J1 [Manis pentadactyla]